MENKDQIKQLITLSTSIGENKAYIQGGGGNTSIKISNNLMAVKASGTKLKEMSFSQGYCVLDYKNLNKYLLSIKKDESDFSTKVDSFSLYNQGRPSIETGFHSLLGCCVAHSHSAYINVLLCSLEGKEIAKNLFPNSIWVDYGTPGIDLTISLREKTKKIKNILDERIVVFLENHGVIVSGPNYKSVLELHKEINATVIDKLALKSFAQNDLTSKNINKVIFPDQVVFTANKKLLRSTSGKETLLALNYILNEIVRLGLTPKYIDDHNIQILQNMESEKYRQSIA
jgi:rhamnose utilization protein RhaD (predicted bifunctional aldolase and dehydrogenase)